MLNTMLIFYLNYFKILCLNLSLRELLIKKAARETTWQFFKKTKKQGFMLKKKKGETRERVHLELPFLFCCLKVLQAEGEDEFCQQKVSLVFTFEKYIKKDTPSQQGCAYELWLFKVFIYWSPNLIYQNTSGARQTTAPKTTANPSTTPLPNSQVIAQKQCNQLETRT